MCRSTYFLASGRERNAFIPGVGLHKSFSFAKPVKGQYKLSTNCLLVLNAAYLYNRCIKTGFTRFALLKFARYYDNVKIGNYMTVLMSNGYIDKTEVYRGHQLYSISAKGIEVIEELNQSYAKEFDLFCKKYNISL